MGLPAGVRIVTAYDRSGLIDRAVDTLKEAIYQEIAIVALITVLFLLHLRSAFVAIISLPLGVLISFILQYQFNITANILSLAGHCHCHRGHGGRLGGDGGGRPQEVGRRPGGHRPGSHNSRRGQGSGAIPLFFLAGADGFFFADLCASRRKRPPVQTPGLHQDLRHGRGLPPGHFPGSHPHGLFHPGKNSQGGAQPAGSSDHGAVSARPQPIGALPQDRHFPGPGDSGRQHLSLDPAGLGVHAGLG